MNDLISRQVAIERATKEHDFYRGASIPTDKARRDELLNVMCWLNELPSAEKRGEWIPVSERMPKEYTIYENVYKNGKPFKNPTSDTKSAVVLATIYGSVEKMFTRNGSWYFDSGAEGFPEMAEDAPTAWMPLPEPYRGEE